jgi:hypothetical protein
VKSLKRTLRVGIATFSGYFNKKYPRRDETLIRHITPRFLEVDGIVSPDAFSLRNNEKEISWRIRREILNQDESLVQYAEYHSYILRKIKIRPGLVGLRTSTLWKEEVFPIHSPEPSVDKKGRNNPYSELHYASSEPSPESKVALAASASENWLLRPYEESLGKMASSSAKSV